MPNRVEKDLEWVAGRRSAAEGARLVRAMQK
jgi:hypothetical protein